MNSKVLVLGSTGLIGHQVYNYLKENSNFHLSNISFRKKLQNDTILVDVRDEYNFINHIKNSLPDYIINCIGVLIEGANADPENAIYINSYIPHRLARLSDEINSKLIHISTDCVFSGSKITPYIESDEKDGKDTYAKTKGLGEIINDNHLTLRTSVLGPELKKNGQELFHWFMCQKKPINGFTNSIWSGVTSIELAKAVKWSIINHITGLYHVTNNKSINKYDILKMFKKHTGKKIEIIPLESETIDKSFIDTRNLMDYSIPSYDQMISEMVKSIFKNNTLYSHYKIKNNSE